MPAASEPVDAGVGPELSTAPAVPVALIVGAELVGLTFAWAALDLFVTVMMIVIMPPLPTDDGVAVIDADKAFRGHVGNPPDNVNAAQAGPLTYVAPFIVSVMSCVSLGIAAFVVPVTTTLNTRLPPIGMPPADAVYSINDCPAPAFFI